MPSKLTVVVCQTRGDRPESLALQNELVSALQRRPAVDVAVVSHLYDLATDGPSMERLRSLSGDLIVLAWMYPRAAYWVLDAGDVKGRAGWTSFDRDRPTDDAQAATGGDGRMVRTIWCIDFHGHETAEALLAEIDRLTAESKAAHPAAADETPDATTVLPATGLEATPATRLPEETGYRWYPVIDYDRCVSCLECLNFCLFGVFGVDTQGQLIVEQPDACRNGCPACSRVCPSTAIMFPRNDDPAIAGDWAMPAKQADLGLVQLFGGPSPQQTAAAERDEALRQQAASQPNASDEDLDRLVDELDEMDI